jgi:outer membrane protein TolC
VSQSQGYNMSYGQLMPWYGGRLTASFNNGRSGNNNINSTRNPSFSSSTQLQYSQPILQGFKIDGTRNNVRTQSIQRQITDLQLQNQVETVKANVRTAYWSLRGAIESIEIQNRSLALALQTDRDNKTKVNIGTLAPIDTTQSEVSVANAQQALLNAQIQWTTAELNLKRLLVSSADDDCIADDQPGRTWRNLRAKRGHQRRREASAGEPLDIISAENRTSRCN